MKDNIVIQFIFKVLLPVLFCFIVLVVNLEFLTLNNIYSKTTLIYISIMNFAILSIAFLEEIRYIKRISSIEQSDFSKLDKEQVIELISNTKIYYVFQTFLLLLLSFFILYLIEGDSMLVS